MHVAICGGAPEARRVAVEAAVVALSNRYRRALGWTDRVLVAEEGAARESKAKASRAKAWHGLAARIVGARPPHDGARFAQLVRRARIEQALCADPEAGVVVTDGSALVDLLASGLSSAASDDRELYQKLQHATAQRRIPVTSWWETAREDPEGWLLNALSLARMHEPTVLVLEDDDPARRRVADLLRRTRRTEVIEPAARAQDRPLDERLAEAIARRP